MTNDNAAAPGLVEKLIEENTPIIDTRYSVRLATPTDMRRAIEAALRTKDEEVEKLTRERDDAKAETVDLNIALGQTRGPSYESPRRGWQCFHCGEWFRTEESARSHFGAKPYEFRDRALAAEKRAEEAMKLRDIAAMAIASIGSYDRALQNHYQQMLDECDAALSPKEPNSAD